MLFSQAPRGNAPSAPPDAQKMFRAVLQLSKLSEPHPSGAPWRLAAPWDSTDPLEHCRGRGEGGSSPHSDRKHSTGDMLLSVATSGDSAVLFSDPRGSQKPMKDRGQIASHLGTRTLPWLLSVSSFSWTLGVFPAGQEPAAGRARAPPSAGQEQRRAQPAASRQRAVTSGFSSAQGTSEAKASQSPFR